MRDRVIAYICIALILAGSFIGMGDDFKTWEILVLYVPISWGILAFVLDQVVNGKDSNSESMYFSLFGAYVAVNFAFLIAHRGTAFIVGRLILLAAYIIMCTRISGDGYKK